MLLDHRGGVSRGIKTGGLPSRRPPNAAHHMRELGQQGPPALVALLALASGHVRVRGGAGHLGRRMRPMSVFGVFRFWPTQLEPTATSQSRRQSRWTAPCQPPMPPATTSALWLPVLPLLLPLPLPPRTRYPHPTCIGSKRTSTSNPRVLTPPMTVVPPRPQPAPRRISGARATCYGRASTPS